jgi:predicted transcriptional regulator
MKASKVSTPQNVLISLEKRHAENILSGSKTVELRRRSMHVAIGTIVWFYVKVPIGCILGRAQVSDVHTLSPSTIWRRFGTVSGLSRGEFFAYFSDSSTAFALGLEKPCRLTDPVSLDELRRVSAGFHPPQFFAHLPTDGALLRAMSRGLPRKTSTAPGPRNLDLKFA